MQQIKIKAFFGDWHEADFQTALKLFKHLLRMHIPENFNRHFKGVAYEDCSNRLKMFLLPIMVKDKVKK